MGELGDDALVSDRRAQHALVLNGELKVVAVGVTKQPPPLKVEFFELFDDPFVLRQFSRKRRLHSAQLSRTTWLPTPEDVIVQKLRGAAAKISTTPAMSSPCRIPPRSTWLTSNSGAPATARRNACATP